MLTGTETVEIENLRSRGWSVSAIARHLDRDRKTVRAYVTGEREPGVREGDPCALEPYGDYLRLRFDEDPHVWATVLFDEVCKLGYDRAYQSFTRHLRTLGLRPHCEACSGVKGRATVEIDHPPGEEIQWDWVELGMMPWAAKGYVLVGSLPFSGKFRAVFADSMDQPHLIEALDGVLRRLGGTARRWRVDRMSTVIKVGTDDVQASFVPVAKYYGVGVDPCPPRRANRKGSVEKSIHYLTQRWWRTAEVTTRHEAQQSLDVFASTIADRRTRRRDGIATTVADMASRERLAELPAVPYPATITVDRKVGQSGLVGFDGNRYSVPHTLIGSTVTCARRLDSETLTVTSPAGPVVATHVLGPGGSGLIVRHDDHAAALQNVILAEFSTERPCEPKPHRPPGKASRAEAARLAGTGADFDDVVIDLAAYAQAVNGAVESECE